MTRYIATAIFSAVTVLSTALSASAFEVPQLTVEDVNTLQNRDAIISVWKDREHEKKPTVSVGGIDIMASAANVFKIMLDCDRAQELSSDIRQCDVIESSTDGTWDVRKQKFAVSPFLPKFKTTFRTNYTAGPNGGHVMNITKISGDMKVQEGRWDIISLGPNKSRVIYQAAIRPKFPVPGKLIREQFTKGIPKILINLRDVAEADEALLTQNTALVKIDDM